MTDRPATPDELRELLAPYHERGDSFHCPAACGGGLRLLLGGRLVGCCPAQVRKLASQAIAAGTLRSAA